jgi:hypothetical protein
MRLEAKEAPAPSTDLAVITDFSAIVPSDFFKAGGSDDILTKLELEVRAQAAKLDISTKAGREAIASLAYKVACSKKPLENLRKGLTEDIRKQKEAIDAEGRDADARLEALQKEVRKPLTDWENADKARKAGHEAALKEIEQGGSYSLENWRSLTVEAMRDRMMEIDTENRDWQEFSTPAAMTKAYATQKILKAIELRETADAAQAEAERLRAEAAERAVREREEAAAKAAKEAAERRAEEQARIAREAAERERQRVENEKAEAEARAKQAEAQRIAAEQQAERSRIAQEERHRLELEAEEKARKAEAEEWERRRKAEAAEAEAAQQRAVEAERQRVAAEKKREAEEAERRAKNRAHIGAVNREALAALAKIGVPEDSGKVIIAAIAKGEIPHVSIAY